MFFHWNFIENIFTQTTTETTHTHIYIKKTFALCFFYLVIVFFHIFVLLNPMLSEPIDCEWNTWMTIKKQNSIHPKPLQTSLFFQIKICTMKNKHEWTTICVISVMRACVCFKKNSHRPAMWLQMFTPIPNTNQYWPCIHTLLNQKNKMEWNGFCEMWYQPKKPTPINTKTTQI